MKSLYGSITRSAVIFLSYVTVMRLPSLSPNGKNQPTGVASMRLVRGVAVDEGGPVGRNGLLGAAWRQFDSRPRLSPLLSLTYAPSTMRKSRSAPEPSA